MLESRETIGKSAHISAALDVVLTAKRIEAAAITPDVARKQTEIDQRKNIVDADDMFRDAESPADLRAISACVGVCELANQVAADTARLLRHTRECTCRHGDENPRSHWWRE